MITAQQLEELEISAWGNRGRPEMRCQVAMADIYKAAGLLPSDLAIPNGPRDWSRAQGSSLIVEWLEQCPHFERVTAGQESPGDLLVFRLGHAPHHVAILLSRGRLVHVFGHHGVQTAPCIPDAWAKRIHSVWRIT
jgi:hypothetical protein